MGKKWLRFICQMSPDCLEIHLRGSSENICIIRLKEQFLFENIYVMAKILYVVERHKKKESGGLFDIRFLE